MSEIVYRMVPVDPRELLAPERSPVPAPDPTPLLLTVEQAAQKLGLSRTGLYDEIARGRLFSVKVGSRRRIPLRSVEDYVARLCADAPWSGSLPDSDTSIAPKRQPVKGGPARRP